MALSKSPDERIATSGDFLGSLRCPSAKSKGGKARCKNKASTQPSALGQRRLLNATAIFAVVLLLAAGYHFGGEPIKS